MASLNASDAPRGTIRVTAPLAAGRRLIAPLVPEFVDQNPEIEVRMRMSDRKVDILGPRGRDRGQHGVEIVHLGRRKPESDSLVAFQSEQFTCLH